MAGDEKQLTKNQHYVPQFYLRKFLNGSNQVEILDCRRKKIITPRGTKGICCEDFFYGLETGAQDEISQHVEDGFQQIEHRISTGIDPIIAKLLNGSAISDAEKWTVGLLMSMLWMRGPEMRTQINEMSEKVMKDINALQFGSQFADQIFDKFDKDTGRVTTSEMREKIKRTMVDKNYSLQFSNQQHLMMLNSIENFANLFFGQHWTVFISKLEKKFVTSDNPVVVTFPARKGFFGPTFLERIHYFALTPDILIKAVYPHNLKGKKLKRKTLFQGDDLMVLDLNIRVAGRARDYAYARDRQGLEDILTEVKRQDELFATPQGQILKKMLEEKKDLSEMPPSKARHK